MSVESGASQESGFGKGGFSLSLSSDELDAVVTCMMIYCALRLFLSQTCPPGLPLLASPTLCCAVLRVFFPDCE